MPRRRQQQRQQQRRIEDTSNQTSTVKNTTSDKYDDENDDDDDFKCEKGHYIITTESNGQETKACGECAPGSFFVLARRHVLSILSQRIFPTVR